MANLNIHQQALRNETRDTILSWLSTRLHQEWKTESLQADEYAKRFTGQSLPDEMVFSPANIKEQPVQYINDVTFKAWDELNKKHISARILFPRSAPPLHSIAIDLSQTNLQGKMKQLEAESLEGHDSSRRYLDIALKRMKGTPGGSTPQR